MKNDIEPMLQHLAGGLPCITQGHLWHHLWRVIEDFEDDVLGPYQYNGEVCMCCLWRDTNNWDFITQQFVDYTETLLNYNEVTYWRDGLPRYFSRRAVEPGQLIKASLGYSDQSCVGVVTKVIQRVNATYVEVMLAEGNLTMFHSAAASVQVLSD